MWVVVRFTDDNIISRVLQGTSVEFEDGTTAQIREPRLGEECLAPWGKKKYLAVILGYSGKFKFNFVF